MPKKYIFYLIGLLLLAGLGYYGYSKWQEAREKVNLWTLVPEDATFVIESGNQQKFVERLKRTQVWESLSEITYLQRLEENIALVDSMGGGHDDIYKFLANKNMLTSVHVVSKTDFDLVFYVPISTVKEHRYVRTVLENLEKNQLFKLSTREYQKIVITDLKNETNGEVFSYFTYRNNLILSQSAVLLESIIRKIQHQQFESIADDYQNINYLTQEHVYANVFINYHNLPPFLHLFLKPELQPDIEYLCGLCRNSMLEFKLDNNKLYLNGFSNPETLNQSFYQHIARQQPKTFQLQQIIPNRMAVLLHFGLDQAERLRQRVSRDKTAHQPDELAMADSLVKTFGGELAVGYLKAGNDLVPAEKVVFARTTSPEKTLNLLQQLVFSTNKAAHTIPYKEKFNKYTIRMVPLPAFPELLFGPLFRGFRQAYYTQVQDYVLFTDNPAALRGMLTDIVAGNVWAKSESQVAFLEETQHEANFSVFVNSVNAWQLLSHYVAEDKKESLLRNESLIKDFNQFSVQFCKKGSQYYTSVLFRQQDALAVKDQLADTLEIEKTVAFKSALVKGPFALHNPINRTLEMAVQDSNFVLHNITAENRVSWIDSVGSPIAGDIIQVPFGSDGKTKYLFVAGNKIHCLDRNGHEIENFPYYLPDTLQPQHLTVIDWNKAGDFRILVDDNLGNFYLFDEAGDLLPGWQPRQLDGKVVGEPQFIRVGNKMVLLVTLANGYVYALDENGETYPGFPFSVKATLQSGAFGKPGNNLRNSIFTLVTVRGEVITFNLAGEIRKRQQLARPDHAATFELIPENSRKTYLICRKSSGRLTLLNPDFTLLLERNFLTSSQKFVQYYLFGGDNIVYAITEAGPAKTYLFDGKAKQIGKTIPESKIPIKLFYNTSGEEYQLYKIFGKEYKKITIKR